MSNTFITIDQFNEILVRLQKLENREQYIGKYEDTYKNVDDLKGKYYTLDKRTEVTDTKIDSLEKVMNERFNTVDEKITSLRTELRITLGAILAVMITIGIKLIFYS